MLFGHGAELERLDGLVASLGRGSGFALVVRGDAGVGKSALLDAVAERPGPRQVLRGLRSAVRVGGAVIGAVGAGAAAAGESGRAADAVVPGRRRAVAGRRVGGRAVVRGQERAFRTTAHNG